MSEARGTPSNLRFGVLAGGTTLRAWQAAVITALLDVEGVRPALLVTDARPAPDRSPHARWSRLAGSRARVWDLYNNIWVARRSAALRPVDVSDVLGDLPRLEVTVERDGYSELFPAEVVAAIRNHNLDFLLRFAFGIIRGDILGAARFGVWSFHHDDEERYRGSPPAFWELVDDVPVSGAVLQRLTERLDGGRILHKGRFRTVRHSYVRNTDTVHFGSSDWPARTCRAILANDPDAGEGTLSRSTAAVYRKPRDSVTARFLVRQATRFVRSQIRGVIRADQWDIGVVRVPIERFLDPGFRPEIEWTGLGSRSGCYAADPFILPGANEPEILYERFDHRRRLGEIWRAPLGRGAPRPAGLPMGGHASYPFVFSFDGETFCVPQQKGASPRLFVRSGTEWQEYPSALPSGEVLDPTIFRHGDRWWLFGTRPGPFSLAQLHVWWADDLRGPYRPHPLNPVKTDVRSARPAGTPFTSGGRLFRPAQECSEGYGTAISLCEIVRLDTRRFEERIATVVNADPSWPFPAGIHTVSGDGELTVIDARRTIFERHESYAELRARLNRRR